MIYTGEVSGPSCTLIELIQTLFSYPPISPVLKADCTCMPPGTDRSVKHQVEFAILVCIRLKQNVW